MINVKPVKNSQRHQSPDRRVLALVGDSQVGLWVVRSLARNGLTVHAVVRSKHGQAAHSRYSGSAWVLENNPSDPGFIDEISELVQLLKAGSITL